MKKHLIAITLFCILAACEEENETSVLLDINEEVVLIIENHRGVEIESNENGTITFSFKSSEDQVEVFESIQSLLTENGYNPIQGLTEHPLQYPNQAARTCRERWTYYSDGWMCASVMCEGTPENGFHDGTVGVMCYRAFF